MHMKLYFSALSLLTIAFLQAQYSTPNTGVNWTLDDIVNSSPTTITVQDNTYILHEDLVVELNDSLRIDQEITLKMDADVEFRVKGYLHIEPTQEEVGVSITSTDLDNPYKGFWFEETAEVIFKKTKIEHGGGLRVITSNFLMDECIVSNNHRDTGGSSSGGAITFSNGSPTITNSIFENNFHPAIGSAANARVYALIENNYFGNNNLKNNNRPQINMGPSGDEGVLRIINNEIVGNPDHQMVGGIAVSSLTGIPTQTEIKDNIVRDNRYGITAIGPVGGEISGNIIENNDAEVNPNNGGSGISLYNTQNFVIRNNEIRRNLWGITLIGTAKADLGTEDNPGNNLFSENGNNGEIYALYNNTENEISALLNCWIEEQESTIEDVEGVIFHKNDDPTLGTVLFDPFLCGEEDGMNVIDLEAAQFTLYPNPAKNAFFIETKETGNVKILDLNGKLIQTISNISGKKQIQINLNSGIYLIEFQNKNQKSVQKLIVK